MSEKPKYRYNHKTGNWDRLYKVDTASYSLTLINPKTGMPKVVKLYGR